MPNGRNRGEACFGQRLHRKGIGRGLRSYSGWKISIRWQGRRGGWRDSVVDLPWPWWQCPAMVDRHVEAPPFRCNRLNLLNVPSIDTAILLVLNLFDFSRGRSARPHISFRLLQCRERDKARITGRLRRGPPEIPVCLRRKKLRKQFDLTSRKGNWTRISDGVDRNARGGKGILRKRIIGERLCRIVYIYPPTSLTDRTWIDTYRTVGPTDVRHRVQSLSGLIGVDHTYL